MEGPAPCFAREPPGSPLAARLASRYYEELDARLPGGFAPDAAATTAADELVEGSGVLLVVRLGGSPVGCGALRRLEGGVGEVKRMWIEPAARGRGLGRALLVALEDEARVLGCARILLDTNVALPEAIALYRANGYELIAAYNENPYATHWFEKRLVATGGARTGTST